MQAARNKCPVGVLRYGSLLSRVATDPVQSRRVELFCNSRVKSSRKIKEQMKTSPCLCLLKLLLSLGVRVTVTVLRVFLFLVCNFAS